MKGYLVWAEGFVKHNDIYHREIEEINFHGHKMFVSKKDYKEIYIVVGESLLDNYMEDLMGLLGDYEKIWLIVNNSVEKIKEVIACWDLLSSNSKIRIWFVDLDKDRKWALNPYAHSSVSPRNRLRKSLESLRSAI